MRLVLVGLSLMMTGCGGDPRLEFLGEWTVTTTTEVMIGGGSTSTQFTESAIFTAGKAPGVVEWTAPSGCHYSATLTSLTDFTLSPTVCPPIAQGQCTNVVYSVQRGSGSRVGTVLSLSASGAVTFDCGGPGSGTFSSVLAGVRKGK